VDRTVVIAVMAVAPVVATAAHVANQWLAATIAAGRSAVAAIAFLEDAAVTHQFLSHQVYVQTASRPCSLAVHVVHVALAALVSAVSRP